MKKLILLSILLIVGSLLAQDSPCKDETYLELKKKKLDEMSDREYQYFINKDTQCNEYLNTNRYMENTINSEQINNLRARQGLDLSGLLGIYGLTVGITIMEEEGLEYPIVLVPILGSFFMIDETTEGTDEFVAPLILSGVLQSAFLFDYILTSRKINSLSNNISYNINPISPSITLTYNFH